MTGYGGVEVFLHSLTTELEVSVQLFPSTATPQRNSPGILWIGERVESRAILEVLENRKIHNSTGKHPRFLGWSSHYRLD